MNQKSKAIVDKLRASELLDAFRALADEAAAHIEANLREHRVTTQNAVGITLRYHDLRVALLSIANNSCCHCCGEAARVAQVALNRDIIQAAKDCALEKQVRKDHE